ncbi:twin-arginine translocase subunit TatC [Shouchella shacheensis]|uniref:twin-arginine translocase subunit TatC n=1 Tax=Shouchella shacheensis TaxID=1649580 RepID=UPI00073FF1EB|nr:twin-arginine translocase subunit TatC [Shouchella shacheensis]
MDMQELPLIEHLGELRKRLILTLSSFILLFVIAFLFVEEIYGWLVRDLHHNLALLGPSDVLWVYFMIAGVLAIAGTIPVAAHQTWLFMRPGLTKREQRVTVAFIPGLFFLFIVGLSFGYFVVYPTVLSFLSALSAENFEMMFTAEKYFKFMLDLTVPFGFIFEIPLVVMFLTSLGVINPALLSKARKISYFVLVLVAVFITPPDLVSDILVTIPLLILYEASVTLSRIVYRKRLKLETKREEGAWEQAS